MPRPAHNLHPRHHTNHPHEDGSVTVVALAVVAVWAVLAGVILTIGGVHAAGARAQSAADLAALAGANVLHNSHHVVGTGAGLAWGVPCDTAHYVVSTSEPNARAKCTATQDDVTVQVTIRVVGFSVTRSARAA